MVSRVTPAMTGFAILVSIQVQQIFYEVIDYLFFHLYPLQMICCSIIRGSGRPKLGIFIHFAFYYCGALPLGITFASYAFTFGLEGRMSKSLRRLTVRRGSAMGREMRNLLCMQGIADPVYSAHWFSLGFVLL